MTVGVGDETETEGVAQVQRALISMQSTARWLVATATAGLAAVTAGLPLSSIFDLDFDDPTVAMAVSAAGAAVVISLFGLIVLSAKVLIYPGVTLEALANRKARLLLKHPRKWDEDWLRKEVATATPLIVAEENFDPEVLVDNHRRALTCWSELVRTGRAELQQSALTTGGVVVPQIYEISDQDSVRRLQAQLELASSVTTRVEEVINLVVVRRRYRTLVQTWIPVLGGISVVTLIGLLYAGSQVTELKLAQPADVVVMFGADLPPGDVPQSCGGKQVPAVAVAGTFSKPVVVSAADRDCTLNQVEIDRKLGLVVPRVPQKSP